MATSRKLKLRQVLGINVRKARLTRDWSQEVLSQKAGLSARYISVVESAQSAVSIDAIEKLAKALDLKEASLLERD